VIESKRVLVGQLLATLLAELFLHRPDPNRVGERKSNRCPVCSESEFNIASFVRN
jgi:hypothetical protein